MDESEQACSMGWQVACYIRIISSSKILVGIFMNGEQLFAELRSLESILEYGVPFLVFEREFSPPPSCRQEDLTPIVSSLERVGEEDAVEAASLGILKCIWLVPTVVALVFRIFGLKGIVNFGENPADRSRGSLGQVKCSFDLPRL